MKFLTRQKSIFAPAMAVPAAFLFGARNMSNLVALTAAMAGAAGRHCRMRGWFEHAD